jgi:PAS domain S-box-containing protein
MASRPDASEQARASALFNLMAAQIPGVVWSTNTDLRVTSAFGSGWAAIGLSLDNVVGKTLLEYFRTDDGESPGIAAHRRALQGESVDYDSRWRGHTYRCHVERLTDQSGAVLGCIAFAHDVTERTQTELALQKAHDELEQRVAARTAELTAANEHLKRAEGELALFRRFAEASGQGFGMGSLDGHIAYVNPAMCRLVEEEKPEDMIGRGFAEYYPEEWMERRTKEVIPALEQYGYWDAEQDVISRHGKRIPTLHHVFLVRDESGTPVRRAFVVTDITERKAAEEALRQNYEELRTIYNQATDGIIIVDAETVNPIRANSAYCRMVKYSEEEVRTISPAQVHPPEILPTVCQHFEAVKQGIVARLEALPLLRKDGSLFYADVVSSQIQYNKRSCWISFFRDITERKKAQDALEKEHRTLRHLLRSSDHERQLIAYEIHDGLAQQLAGAIMQFQTYAHLKATKPKEAANAYDAGMTMLHQGHFEVRRLISGVRPPILDESGIVAAVAHLVNEQRLQNGPKIEFQSDVDFDRLVPLLENAIYRIVQEGLANACKHSGSKRVRVEVMQYGDDLRITIRDWGTGFDPATVEDDRFGLEGIRERTRLLGGNTTVESAPGQGTCLTVELPLVLRK